MVNFSIEGNHSLDMGQDWVQAWCPGVTGKLQFDSCHILLAERGIIGSAVSVPANKKLCLN